MKSPLTLRSVASAQDAVTLINQLSDRYFKQFRRKETVGLSVSITTALFSEKKEKVDVHAVRMYWDEKDPKQVEEAAWFEQEASFA